MHGPERAKDEGFGREDRGERAIHPDRPGSAIEGRKPGTHALGGRVGGPRAGSGGLWRGYRPQHCLYFLPELQGQGSLRPTWEVARAGLALAFSRSAAASETRLPPWCAAGSEPGRGSAPEVSPPNAVTDWWT